jgi:hypothetical protein
MSTPAVKISSKMPPTSRPLNDNPFWTALSVFSPTESLALLEKVVAKATKVFDGSEPDAATVKHNKKLIERLNVAKIGNGNTLPEKQVDRDDVKWTLRSTQTKRSVLQ